MPHPDPEIEQAFERRAFREVEAYYEGSTSKIVLGRNRDREKIVLRDGRIIRRGPTWQAISKELNDEAQRVLDAYEALQD